MVNDSYLSVGEVSITELIQSQKLNISSKKYRQFKRIRITSIFWGYAPNWYNCIKDFGGSYVGEFKILVSKFIKESILKLHINKVYDKLH